MVEAGEGRRNFVSSGFLRLDKILGGGFIRGGLYILGARPAVGKSTFSINLADNIQGNCLFVSLEMTPEQITSKRVSRLTGLSSARLLSGRVSEEDWTRIAMASNADMEIERQRKLLADQYSAAIKKATADNDMARAQDLYEAAKAEDEQLLGYRKSISSLLAQKGDTSVQDSFLKGETPSPDYSGETWAQVLKNEGSINEIYDKQLESELLGLQMEHDKSMSDLDAEQQKNRAETDRRLTEAYVDALKKNRNYQELQTAYGQGSGTAAQARLARETELQKKLTDLRSVQLGTDADIGMQRYDLGQTYRDQLAKQNNYSVLGKLYGLTQDQIDRIQGTGRYAPQPVYYGGAVRRAEHSPCFGIPIQRRQYPDAYHPEWAVGPIPVCL